MHKGASASDTAKLDTTAPNAGNALTLTIDTDVNNDGFVSAIDALLVINDMNANGARPLAGRTALDRLAIDLELDQAEEGVPPRIRLPRHATIVLIGDFLSPLEDIQAVVGALSSLPARGYLLQVLDPAEALLPYDGRIRFRGVEQDGDTLIPRVSGVRDAYMDRLRAQQEGLASICAAAGFGFGVHRTDHPPEAALLTLYTALGVR